VPPTTGCRTKADQNGACCSGDIELDNALDYTSVPVDAFRDCPITSVKGGANVKIIGDNAFYESGLVSVDLSETQVETIGEWAYRFCRALTSITFPSTVKIIGVGAFSSTGPVSVDLSETQVETIGARAYFRCTALTSIKLPSTVTSIGGEAFGSRVYPPCESAGSSANTLYVPASLALSVYSAVKNSCTVKKYPEGY
jgi:hypothetical protein